MKTKLLGMMLLAGSALFAAPRISVGIGVGTPAYYPPAAVVAQPPSPGPGYVWVDGYWAPNGAWVAGYWAPPAYYAAPGYPVIRHDGDRDRFVRGDRDHERDQHHDGGRDRGEGFRR